MPSFFLIILKIVLFWYVNVHDIKKRNKLLKACDYMSTWTVVCKWNFTLPENFRGPAQLLTSQKRVGASSLTDKMGQSGRVGQARIWASSTNSLLWRQQLGTKNKHSVRGRASMICEILSRVLMIVRNHRTPLDTWRGCDILYSRKLRMFTNQNRSLNFMA